MNKIYWVIGALIVIVIAGIYIPRRSQSPAPVATSTTPTAIIPNEPVATTTPSILPYGSVTLALGETATFADISVTPTAVTEDSRCPKDVQCIQAGTVKVRVTTHTVRGTSTQVVILDKFVTTAAEKIAFVAVAPDKVSTTKIADADYQFTFDVEKLKPVTAGCYVGGCSREICSDTPGAISACMFRPEYECYKGATCERQGNGQCGWTETQELQMCLANLTQ
ncbi:hypothetical protein KW785_02190 [Candidatus Parcubacteria bacterium]|nr:hypothetical protein [Candidatus Parcubacteria bacterium]